MNLDGIIVILFVGVNGVGKIIMIGKLVYCFKQQGKKVIMVVGDIFCVGVIEQFEVWGQCVGVEVIKQQVGLDLVVVMYDVV